ncbi:hypothetical protein Vi05172_g11600 [Venturia inaequalis]|nr:hypothetical protein Vi05172_g11600 [Venturia inaequalis]
MIHCDVNGHKIVSKVHGDERRDDEKVYLQIPGFEQTMLMFRSNGPARENMVLKRGDPL